MVKDSNYLGVKAVLLFILGNSLVAGVWLDQLDIQWTGFHSCIPEYQAELLTESVAGHKGFPGYHFVVALFGTFPASLFALGGLRKRTSNEDQEYYVC